MIVKRITFPTSLENIKEIVKKLTKDIIEQAIKSYAKDDAYWLKLHHLSTEFDIGTLNALRDNLIK